MKPLRLLAATAAAWATALVALATPPPPPARFSVAAEQGEPFGLTLDGQALTWPVARQVHSGLLQPGWHRADVSLPAPYGPPVRFSTQVWLEPGRDNDYVLVLRRSGPQLRPVAPAAGPGYPGAGGYPAPGGPATPGGAYPAYPNGSSGAYPAPAPPTGSYPGSGSYPAPDNSGYPSGNGSYPAPGGSYPGNSGYPGQPAPGGNGYPSQPAPGGSYPGGNGYPAGPNGGYYPGGTYLQALAPAEVARLQQSLNQRPFDDDRLAIVKQALGGSVVRADELTVLVRMLSFDRSRVELAKFGYAHVSDPQNFYRVYEALQFSSSVREVQQALGLPR